jgi:hypothetical protein
MGHRTSRRCGRLDRSKVQKVNMTRLESALSLAQKGFWIFPIAPGKKSPPALKNWQGEATRDADVINLWWDMADYNVGISTSRFGNDQALVVVDVDNKGEKNGSETIIRLEWEGNEFPPTFEQQTAGGGRHLVYASERPLRQGVDTLGVGIDIRSKGGYIVAPGSEADGRPYSQIDTRNPEPVPQWIVDRLGASRDVDRLPAVLPNRVDSDRAADRARDFLVQAPVAVEGNSGDQTTYKVAARLKDLGCDQMQAEELMLEHWNERCSPPWDESDLREKVAHAYRYGVEQPGIAAPEAVFTEVAPVAEPEAQHPFAAINSEYAFIKAGAFVLQETTNEDGEFTTMRLPVSDFHAWFANQPFQVGKEKPRPISQYWMEWKDRRQYDAVVFSPGKDPGARWYNLWRGFTVQPADKASHPSVEAFKEHALKNVCQGNESDYRYLMGFFAHMIQRPWEKPLVALVFRGAKGVGKNALLERVGALLGSHFVVADDDRYLLGNFNSHLESNLFFILDEAAWAGDKRAEGKLKGLITGQKRLVEHKGKEARNVKSLSRVAIIGNEDWLVPASEDERRYAVFNVGDGRKQDRKFFQDMREGMEAGGYANLLRFLMDYDLTGFDVNQAPQTEGLLDQKLASLGPVQKWWCDCLTAGEVTSSDLGGVWPEKLQTARLREAFTIWSKKHNVRSWLLSDKDFGKQMRIMSPSLKHRKIHMQGSQKVNGYEFPTLEKARAEWEVYIGQPQEWGEE